MKKITKDKYLSNFIEHKYRDLILKPALKAITKHQEKSEAIFWTMPYDSICKSTILNGFYEIALLNGMCEIAKNPNGIALDIGANIGNHSIFFSRKFKAVIAVEPAPSNCLILKSNLHLNNINNVTLIEKGLLNKNSKMALDNVDSKNTNNGISEIKSGVSQALIDVVIGDEELQKMNLKEKIQLIKIDVEGRESLVIEGLKKTIEKDMPIIFWEAFTKKEVDEAQSLLKSMGYKNFYHLTPNRFEIPFLNKLWKSFSKATFLVPLEFCKRLDGMNVASKESL
jgi:FkbM family methyltransferase